MKLSSILELIWLVILTIFLIKGMLSDFGYVEKFSSAQTYQFAYLAFAMSAFYFMEKFGLEPLREKNI